MIKPRIFVGDKRIWEAICRDEGWQPYSRDHTGVRTLVASDRHAIMKIMGLRPPGTIMIHPSVHDGMRSHFYEPILERLKWQGWIE